MGSEIADQKKDEKLRANSECAAKLLEIGFPESVLDCLGDTITASRLLRYAPGDTIYHARSEVEALYMVASGRIKLLSVTSEGDARIVRLHNRGSILGLGGMLEETNDHTAVAIDEVSLYQIPMRLIKSIKDKDNEAYCSLLEYLNEYLKMADTWITDFSTGSIRGRVARLILYLMRDDESTGTRDVALLTVNEMAEILGVTPESVSRTMAEFKRQNFLLPVDDDSHNTFHCNFEALSGEAE
jgi:CRP/FNR family transcriptional regulator, anaerobic regulatory protein